MHDLFHRAAVGVLLLVGVLTSQSPLAGIDVTPSPFADSSAMPVVLQLQLMLGLLGAGLVLAAFVPALRLAAIGGGILSKAGFLAISLTSGAGLSASQWQDAGLLLLLVGAAVVFIHEARQQARWDGVLPSRQEA